MLLIRYMGARELLDHRYGRNPICTIEWSEKAHSSNRGWCFFPLDLVSHNMDKDEIREFMLMLSRDIGHLYDYYMIVEGSIDMHHGEYSSLGIIQEFGTTDFSNVQIIKTGICR